MSQSKPDTALMEQRAAAQKLFAAQVASVTQAYELRLSQFGYQQRAALQAKASRIVEQAALIEITLGQQRSLFESENYPTGFNQEAVRNLNRHRGIWSWLLVVATDKGKFPLPHPDASDPFYEQIKNEKPEKLKTRFQQLAGEADELVQAWKRVAKM